MRLLKLIIILAVVFLYACSESATDIVLNIYSDYRIPEEMDKIELKLFRAGNLFFSKEYQILKEDELPVKILITQENDVEELIGIDVVGKNGDYIIAEEITEKAFVKNKRIEVDIYLKKHSGSEDVGFDVDIIDIQDRMEDGDILTDEYINEEAGTDLKDIEESADIQNDVGCIDGGCGDNARCVDGICKCEKGFDNCNNRWDDGCEANILNDPDHCGNCSIKCNPLNVENPLCKDGNCDYDSCKLMYEDRDSNRKNGCEKFNYFPKVYGGEKDELMEDMIITKNGDIVLIATTKSCCSGSTDLWVMRLDRNGNIIWQRIFGGDKEIKGPLKIVELEDENLMIVGSTNSFGVQQMAGFIIKIDRNGNIIKSRIMDNGEWITLKKVECDKSLNCIMLGSASIEGDTGLDLFEAKMDKDLNITSQRLFRVKDVQGESVEILPDSYVCSSKDSSFNSSILVLDLNNDRSLRYVRRVNSSLNLNLIGCIQITDEGIYCSIYTGRQIGIESDVVIFKFNYGNNGSIGWKRAFGDNDMDFGMISRSSNLLSLYLAGTSVKGGISRAFFMVFDLSGNSRFSKYFNGSIGDVILHSLMYNNDTLLLGGMSMSYGAGGMDLLVAPVNIKGENISECHFENEGDISFNFYEPDMSLEDIIVDEILETDFQFKDVTFNSTESIPYGVKSICE